MPEDHFYTTDYHGEIAPDIGYSLDRESGFVFTSQQPDTVPIHRFFNPETGDHLYHRNSDGGNASDNGYKYEHIGWYIHADKRDKTTALRKWWSNDLKDHLYTMDPDDEAADRLSYVNEGVIGYVYTSQQPGTVPLRRWIKSRPRYEIEWQTLKTWCYDRRSGKMEVSKLNLRHCLAIRDDGWGNYNLRAENTPDNLKDPDPGYLAYEDLQITMDKNNTSLTMHGGDNIHCRHVNDRGHVTDSDCNVDQYIRRCTADGIVEFVHP